MPHRNGPMVTGFTGLQGNRQLFYKSWESKLNHKDNFVILKNKRICVIKNFLQNGNDYFFVGRLCTDQTDLYNLGNFKSSFEDIYKCSKRYEPMSIWSVDDIYCKAVRFKVFEEPKKSNRQKSNSFAFFPLFMSLEKY